MFITRKKIILYIFITNNHFFFLNLNPHLENRGGIDSNPRSLFSYCLDIDFSRLILKVEGISHVLTII